MKITVHYGVKRPGPEPYSSDTLEVSAEIEAPDGDGVHGAANVLYAELRGWVDANMPKYEKAPQADLAPQPRASTPTSAATQLASEPGFPERAPAPASNAPGNWRQNFQAVCQSLGVDPADDKKRKALETRLIRHFSKWQVKKGPDAGKWVGTMATGYIEWMEKGRNKAGDPQTEISVQNANEGIANVAKMLSHGDPFVVSFNMWNRDVNPARMDWKEETLTPRLPGQSDMGQPEAPHAGGFGDPPDHVNQPAQDFPSGGDFQLPDDVPF